VKNTGLAEILTAGKGAGDKDVLKTGQVGSFCEIFSVLNPA
jgi:hypothetical protein